MMMQDLVDKQIIQIEASPQQKKIEELKKRGERFVDDRFPPNLRSLTGEWGNVAEWKDVKWAKLSEKMPNAKMF
jgi:hypothetical protein